MAFNSISYLGFLCLVVGLFFALPQRYKIFWLLGTSYYFYAQWNAFYLIFIVFSSLLDWFCALRIETEKSKHPQCKTGRWWLALSLASNLGLLFTFKYLGFFVQVAEQIAATMGRPFYAPGLNLLLPVGISFYTLQTLSATMDVANGKIKAEKSPWRFATYVAFFPQLVAGPIERSSVLLPQFYSFSAPQWSNLVSGVQRILWGLLKKTVIADRLASYVQDVLLLQAQPSASAIFCAAILANVLIYADFSAYSDIAIGSARLMNIHIRENFNFPLFSRSMPDFWKRWHISLHSFFLDYVYYPLGGSKVNYCRWMLNISAVFILSGLWHGAAWNFVLWSIYHLSLVLLHIHIAKLWKYLQWPSWEHPWWTPFRILLVHLQRALSMILFFVPDIEKALNLMGRIFTGPWPLKVEHIFPYAMLINVILVVGFVGLMVVEFLHLRKPWGLRLKEGSIVMRYFVAILVVLCIMIFGVETNNPFIYFQF